MLENRNFVLFFFSFRWNYCQIMNFSKISLKNSNLHSSKTNVAAKELQIIKLKEFKIFYFIWTKKMWNFFSIPLLGSFSIFFKAWKIFSLASIINLIFSGIIYIYIFFKKKKFSPPYRFLWKRLYYARFEIFGVKYFLLSITYTPTSRVHIEGNFHLTTTAI